jgi:hypothetical protein
MNPIAQQPEEENLFVVSCLQQTTTHTIPC